MIPYSLLCQTVLFRDFTPEQVKQAIESLGAAERMYEAGQTVLCAGEMVSTLGIVTVGAVHIVQNDVWGRQAIIGRMEPGQVFAETYAYAQLPLSVDVVAAAPETNVLFLEAAQLTTPSFGRGHFHAQLAQNLLAIMAARNLELKRKIDFITPRSIRERLLAYLSVQAMEHGSPSFDLPFNRQQLADYLSVDRSALSAELSKMQRDGLIDYHKNHFTLHGAMKWS